MRVAAELALKLAPCPTLPRNWWPAGAVAGYCDATEDEGDCERGHTGSFKAFEQRGLWRSEAVSIQDCAALCSRCRRCNYFSVSISPDVTDCSWYHACDLTRRLPTLRGASFVSMSLKGAQRYKRVCRGRYDHGAC